MSNGEGENTEGQAGGGAGEGNGEGSKEEKASQEKYRSELVKKLLDSREGDIEERKARKHRGLGGGMQKPPPEGVEVWVPKVVHPSTAVVTPTKWTIGNIAGGKPPKRPE